MHCSRCSYRVKLSLRSVSFTPHLPRSSTVGMRWIITVLSQNASSNTSITWCLQRQGKWQDDLRAKTPPLWTCYHSMMSVEPVSCSWDW